MKKLIDYLKVIFGYLGICTVVILITLGLYIMWFYEKPQQEVIEDKVEIVDESILSFKDELYNYLKQMNVQHPDIVVAQAILESGNFTSKLFKEHNNFCGMTVARQRPTTANRIPNSVYAGYNSWQECATDYIFWQIRYGLNKTREQYFELLKVYAQDPNYIVKLKSLLNEQKNND
jgi:uncharacterized FlgJ-related protein